MNHTATIFGIMLLLVASAFFSASETAFTSASPIRLKKRAADGDRRAAQALKLLDSYDILLSVILIGNNVVNITAAALSTALFVSLMGDRGITVATIVLTILTLVFGEVSPKTVAKENPEPLALAFTPALQVIMVLVRPLALLLQQIQRLVLALVGSPEDKTITEEELMSIVDEVEEGGNIEAREGALIRSAILFDDQYVRDVYTPRVKVVAVSEEDSYEDVHEVFMDSGFSRLPLYRENIDNILGVIHVKDFYAALLADERPPLTDLAKPLAFILQNRDLARLMSALQRDKSHMAVVTDEYGGTVGIVTLEDIIEELVGDILDEHDQDEPVMRKVAPGVYVMEGQTEVEDVLPRFGIPTDDIEAQTVGGWITDLLGHIPQVGETVQVGKIKAKVEAATPRYVESVRITIVQGPRA